MSIEMLTVAVPKCTCERCGHTWCPDIKLIDGEWVAQTPVTCAKCKKATWNRKPNKTG